MPLTPKTARVFACLLGLITTQEAATAQTTYTYSTTNTSTSWMNSANWTGNSGHFPGVDLNASSTADGASTDIAVFGSIAASSIGINFNTSANTGVSSNTGAAGQLSLGLIDFATTLNKSLIIGNSAGVPSGFTVGTLLLNGGTINSVADTVLSNESSQNVTLQARNGGSADMVVGLGDATDNVMQVNGTGTLTISTVVKDGSGNKHLTVTSNGAGALILSGANTYSGGTTVSKGILRVSNASGTSATGTASVTIGNNTGVATLQGTGYISGLVSTVTTGGNIAHLTPGAGSALADSGTLHLGGGLTIGTGTNLDFNLGTASDLIALSAGTLTLGSGITLNVTQNTGFALGTTYSLITYTGSDVGSGNLASWTATGGGGVGTTATFGDTGSTITVTFNSSSNFYFDTNGATAGSGATTGITYSFAAGNWSSSAAGTATTGNFTNGSTPTFAAGTDSGGNTYTVAVDTAVNANGLTFEEGNVTLSSGGGTLTLTGPSVNVAGAATATISQPIGGTVGLTKDGQGLLTLSGANIYTGTTTINAGILSVSSDANLGDAANGVSLNTGTLQTTTSFQLSATRAFNGTGTLDVAPATTLTFQGTVGATTPGVLTLANTGVVAFTNATTNAVTGLIFNAAGTLSDSGTALGVAGNVTTTQPAGSATISGTGVSLGSATRTYTVADGSAATDLLISAPITSSASARLQKRGAGTLELTGDNSGLFGVQLGSQGTGVNFADGGRLLIDNKNALGAAGNTIQLNYGTLEASSDLTGANAIVSGSTATGGQLSIGGRTTGFPTFAGSNMEYTGGLGFFRATGTSGELRFNVNNTTTISGTGVATSGGGTATGVTIAGTGTLVLSGNNSAISDRITVEGGTLLATNTAGSATGTGAVIINNNDALLGGGTMSGIGGIAGAVTVTAGVLTAGSVAAPAVLTLGALTLSTNSTTTLALNSGTPVRGTTYSGFNIGGPVAVDGALSLTGTYIATANSGDIFFILDNTSASTTTGTFASVSGLPSGYGVIYGADFENNSLSGGNDIALAAVPEPSAVAVAFGLVGLVGWRERKRLKSKRYGVEALTALTDAA